MYKEYNKQASYALIKSPANTWWTKLGNKWSNVINSEVGASPEIIYIQFIPDLKDREDSGMYPICLLKDYEEI